MEYDWQRETRHLYRYRPLASQDHLDREIKSISDRTLWFSSPLTFNDPYEFILDLRPGKVSLGDLRDILTSEGIAVTEKDNAWLRRQRRKVKGFGEKAVKLYRGKLADLRNNKGVCCFSKKRDEPLLWGHYASCHTGICFEYETPKLAHGTSQPLALIEIQYLESPPMFDMKGGMFDAQKDEIFDISISSKSMPWKYECEVRAYADSPGPKACIPDKAISAVYFGMRCKSEHKRLIMRAVRAVNPKAKSYDAYQKTNSYRVHMRRCAV